MAENEAQPEVAASNSTDASAADDKSSKPRYQVPPDHKNIYICHLPYSYTKEDLEKLLAGQGKITEVKILVDPRTNRSRGVGFVHFESREDAQRAIDFVHNMSLAGHSQPLQARFAKVNKRDGSSSSRRGSSRRGPPSGRRYDDDRRRRSPPRDYGRRDRGRRDYYDSYDDYYYDDYYRSRPPYPPPAARAPPRSAPYPPPSGGYDYAPPSSYSAPPPTYPSTYAPYGAPASGGYYGR